MRRGVFRIAIAARGTRTDPTGIRVGKPETAIALSGSRVGMSGTRSVHPDRGLRRPGSGSPHPGFRSHWPCADRHAQNADRHARRSGCQFHHSARRAPNSYRQDRHSELWQPILRPPRPKSADRSRDPVGTPGIRIAASDLPIASSGFRFDPSGFRFDPIEFRCEPPATALRGTVRRLAALGYGVVVGVAASRVPSIGAAAAGGGPGRERGGAATNDPLKGTISRRPTMICYA